MVKRIQVKMDKKKTRRVVFGFITREKTKRDTLN